MPIKKLATDQQIVARYKKLKILADELQVQIKKMHKQALALKSKIRKQLDQDLAKDILKKIK